MKKLGLLLTSLIMSSTLQAGNTTIGFEQVGIVNSGGKVYALIQLDRTLPSNPECADGYAYQLSFEISDQFGELTYSTALAAVVAQKKAYVSFSDTNCGLWGSRPIATRIDIQG